MTLDRERIEAAFQAIRGAVVAGDYSRFADLFAEDGTFANPLTTEPVRGREALRHAATGWPKVVNRVEW